jgi:hypothetical protein
MSALSSTVAGVVTVREIARLRLAALRIAGPGLGGPGEAVRLLTCAQAQDYPGALTSVALRVAGGTRADVAAALDAGEIVRSWPMRGTLHLVLAEDLRWMLDLTTERLIRGAATRRAGLGLDEATIERARELAVKALTGGGRLRRDGLLEVWEQGGVSTTGQRGYHLIWNLAQTGTLCFGPTIDREQALVLLDEWVPAPRRPTRDEALGEWALRYFRGHGPATVKDFTRWTGLTAKDVKIGLAYARPLLERLEVDGVEYLMDPATPALLDACRNAARGVFLLPGFDEYVLGYADRTAAVPAEHAQLIVPGNNGMFKPTVVVDGRVVGTWKRAGSGARRRLVAEPFTAFPPAVDAALAALADIVL